MCIRKARFKCYETRFNKDKAGKHGWNISWIRKPHEKRTERLSPDHPHPKKNSNTTCTSQLVSHWVDQPSNMFFFPWSLKPLGHLFHDRFPNFFRNESPRKQWLLKTGDKKCAAVKLDHFYLKIGVKNTTQNDSPGHLFFGKSLSYPALSVKNQPWILYGHLRGTRVSVSEACSGSHRQWSAGYDMAGVLGVDLTEWWGLKIWSKLSVSSRDPVDEKKAFLPIVTS